MGGTNNLDLFLVSDLGGLHYEIFCPSLLQCWRHVFVFTYLLGVRCVSISKQCVSKITESHFSFGAAVCYIIVQVGIMFAFAICLKVGGSLVNFKESIYRTECNGP